jgi:hypothetical protein
MDILFISAAAFTASVLTFFSGFGLGTILMPVFLFFFSMDIAIALTAVVHLLNNLLKTVLLYKKTNWSVVGRFGLPAFVCAFVGAWILIWLEHVPAVYAYQAFGRLMNVTPVKLTIAAVIFLFVFLESVPKFKNMTFNPKWMPAGGMLSGFFGGLSGHQGALRSMFLMKAGLSKDEFVATGVIIACLVDVSRLAVYRGYVLNTRYEDYFIPMAAATLAAFAGVFLANRLMKKVTLDVIQKTVSCLLFLTASLLAAGVI